MTAPTDRRTVALWIAAGLLPASILALLIVVQRGGSASQPRPIAWGAQTCAQCGQVVADRAFAAQLTGGDGRVLAFDDPGCLLVHEVDAGGTSRWRFFRHVRQDRWIDGARVRFVRVPESPRGYGFGAVDEPEGGTLRLEATRRACLKLERSRQR